MRVYRFRSIDALLDKFHELENQTIYFASPDQLNDPMEGFRDIVWRGDKIVWTNFFQHYVYYLSASYRLFKTTGNLEELDVDDIPILGEREQPLSPQIQRLFDEVWHRLLDLPKTLEIIEALANTNRKIRYRELEFYLRIIQVVFLGHVPESDYVYEGISESERLQLTRILTRCREKLGSILISLKQIENLEIEEANRRLHEVETRNSNERIIRLLNNPIFKEMLGESYQPTFFDFLIFDLPRKYLKKIEMLLWPKWYTACFMKDYHNSSVWGHYGDGHKGVCLIFEPPKLDDSNNFQLYHLTDEGDNPTIQFSKVSYTKKPGKVDFFRSLGTLSADDLMKLWYTDKEGNISECTAHLLHDNDTYNWIEDYRESIYRDITSKTKDWKYEQEYRLVLSDWENEYNSAERRTLRYDFNSLKGIIFGIKTTDQDKLRIINIIKRTDFKFYQAYYSPEEGNIQKYRIPLPPLDGTATSEGQAS